MTKVAYIMLSNAVSITIDNGDNHVINSSHPNYNAIVGALKTKQYDSIPNLIDIPKAIAVASKGAVQVVHGQVRYNDLPVHSYLATRILDLMSQGFDIKPWTNFMEKLYSNPDPFSITQLYEFLERAKLPLCPDGDFLAYKYVRTDFRDCHTGKFNNSVGQTVTEDRKLCDNNPDNHCSKGLHFCAKGYLPSYGNGTGKTVVIVKVNPRDVVSIPKDHNCEKARACRYVVVGVLDEDYSIEDMEKSAVLPSPRNVGDLNKAKTKKTFDKGPTPLQLRILKSDGLTVRQVAKNLGVTQADIVNAAGEYFTLAKNADNPSLGYMCIKYTKKGWHHA